MTEELVTFETAKLARKKGFDEICRNMWMAGDKGPSAINAPKDEEMIGGFLAMFMKYKDDPLKFIEQMEKRIPKPLRNSTLPETLFSRPSQDLLERWFREKHRILAGQLVVQGGGKVIGYRAVVIKMDLIHLDAEVPTKEYATMELAREAALLQALTLLSDA